MCTKLHCPSCLQPVWDLPHGHKLAKCWNTEGHPNGETLAFDTLDMEEGDMRLTGVKLPGD